MNFKSVAFLLFIIFAGLDVIAQVKNIAKDTLHIEEVVVTGSPVKINRDNVPMSVSVVSQAQLSESSESAVLPVLSGQVPGLFVTERGVTGFGVSTGSAGQITIRGIGGNPTTGVLMLIDGHPQFMGIMGHPLPDSYVTSDIERVEVIRGSGSVLYGSNAMGGVINLITKKQEKDGFHGNSRLMYGTFNTQKYMLSGGYKKDKLSVYISGNHDQTDGHRANSDFKISNGYSKIGYDVNEHLKLGLDFSLAKFKSQDPGPDTLNAKKGEAIDITRGYGSFTAENEFGKASGAAKLFYNFGEHNITDGFHSTDHNYGLNLFEAFKLLEGNTVTLGFDYMNFGGLAENLKAMGGKGIIFADTAVYELGYYGFVQQTFAKKLTVNGGLRLQHNQVYGNELIPSAGIAWRANSNTTWKASFSKGFRSPTIRELFLWGPNPKLQPETVFNYEAGILKSFFERKLAFELTGFIVKGDNLIITIPLKGLQNAGEVDNKGIEFSADARPNKNLSFHTAYSYIHMKNPVYATPKHQLYISSRYHFNKTSLAISLQHVADLDTDPSSSVHTEDFTLLNVRVGYRPCQFSEIFFNGENLLNQRYEQIRFYPMPRTTFFAGINLNF
ncbi:MAG TPA: TonB-dependent receptor [Prolixibacteraceae bacterium]|nr:TonB-dependent receptor [Prolixibacteraceae bacterium]